MTSNNHCPSLKLIKIVDGVNVLPFQIGDDAGIVDEVTKSENILIFFMPGLFRYLEGASDSVAES